MRKKVECKLCGKALTNAHPNRAYCNNKCREKYRYHHVRKNDNNYKKKQAEKAKKYYAKHKEEYSLRANNFRQTEKYKKYRKLLIYSGREVYRGIQRRCSGSMKHLARWYNDKGIQCKITLNDFLNVYWSTNVCNICSSKLEDFDRNDKFGRTVDRIDSNGHYEHSNIQILCRTCNTRKSTTGGIKVGLKSGVFALVTAAHVRAFEYMKTQCHYLCIFMNDDDYLLKKKGSIIVPAIERAHVLRAMSDVDEVIVYSGNSEHESIKRYKDEKLWRFGPESKSIMFHSPEFIGRDFIPGKQFVDEVVYTPFYDGLSSTSDIMERIIKGSESGTM